MSSGGWLGHTVSKAWHGVTRGVRSVMGIPSKMLFGQMARQTNNVAQETPTYVASAAPAPTATEQAEYDAAIQNQKKKRGKNSLFVSSSAGSSGGGSGVNL